MWGIIFFSLERLCCRKVFSKVFWVTWRTKMQRIRYWQRKHSVMILVTLQSYLYTLHDTVSGNSGAPIGSLEKSSRQGETYTKIILNVSDCLEKNWRPRHSYVGSSPLHMIMVLVEIVVSSISIPSPQIYQIQLSAD